MGLFKNKKTSPMNAADSHKTLHKHLEFTASEQYRLLRTNMQFTIPEGEKCPVIGITSSTRGEGKSTTAVNLSYVIAERGKKVLLIDGDLRIPSVAKKMGIDSSPGLTDLLLNGQINISELQSPYQENWYIMPSGDIPPNPSELLGSGRMRRALEKLREQFEYIIIDLPPVNLVSDAMSISGYITGMILVIRENYATKKDVESCIRQIKLSNVNVLGCVMNESDDGSGSYRRYGKYKNNKYYKDYRSHYYESSETQNRGKKGGNG